MSVFFRMITSPYSTRQKTERIYLYKIINTLNTHIFIEFLFAVGHSNFKSCPHYVQVLKNYSLFYQAHHNFI